MYGTTERDLKFPTPVPVNITYQTAWIDSNGKLETRRDLYGIDSRMQALLRNEKNKISKPWSHTPSRATHPRAATFRKASPTMTTVAASAVAASTMDRHPSSSGCSAEARRPRRPPNTAGAGEFTGNKQVSLSRKFVSNIKGLRHIDEALFINYCPLRFGQRAIFCHTP